MGVACRPHAGTWESHENCTLTHGSHMGKTHASQMKIARRQHTVILLPCPFLSCYRWLAKCKRVSVCSLFPGSSRISDPHQAPRKPIFSIPMIVAALCPMLRGANGFSFQTIFLCCTELCLIVEGAQGNYKFVYNYPRPRIESLLDQSTFHSNQSIELFNLNTWLD
jgi:hypothetical protein